MAQPIKLPVVFKFVRIPVRWVVQPQRTRTLLIAELDRKQRQRYLDGWECREAFFKLPEDDIALCNFMTDVGLWETESARPSEATQDYWVPWLGAVHIPRILHLSPERVWWLRKQLIHDLRDPAKFIRLYGTDEGVTSGLMPDHLPFRFKLEDKTAVGVVTTASFWEMLLTTIYVDFVKGFHLEPCQRPDCPMMFTVETGHKRKYCSQYCGHLESIRRNRRLAKKIKKGTKP